VPPQKRGLSFSPAGRRAFCASLLRAAVPPAELLSSSFNPSTDFLPSGMIEIFI